MYIMWALQYIHDIVKMAYRLLGAAHKVVPISENRRKKIQVIHELGNRLNGGQCQNKIGGEHLHHVGIAMHA